MSAHAAPLAFAIAQATYGGVRIVPTSAGSSLGACNWLLHHGYQKVSDHTERGAKGMVQQRLPRGLMARGGSGRRCERACAGGVHCVIGDRPQPASGAA